MLRLGKYYFQTALNLLSCAVIFMKCLKIWPIRTVFMSNFNRQPFCWHLNALHYGNFVYFLCRKDQLHTFYIIYKSLRTGQHLDQITYCLSNRSLVLAKRWENVTELDSVSGAGYIIIADYYIIAIFCVGKTNSYIMYISLRAGQHFDKICS